ncbi:unnamed protein product [Rhizoctonia solani]|uniref:Mandelate racemase/muconate lactonizing enzyme C-terminal domain-containing protein n=1 Tax=Rhizoctonia solani TaxID=456999 RepID=A0A8H3H5X5_9AGAM|nr:unnamed protein product [Rhizoctonia solani]
MSLQTTTSHLSAITKVEVFRVPPRWLFVRVEVADGTVGWGEGTLEGHTEAVEGAFLELKERFMGWDADNIEDIWSHAYRARFYRGGEVLMSALAGLDIALWDIKGKRLGVPIWQLLGGKVRDRCKVYGWIGGDKPNDVVNGARARKEQGFTAVKMNGTESVAWIDSPAVLEATIERVAAVKALGLDVGIDFHGRVHKGMAKQLARRLEEHQPLFIEGSRCEEPLLPTQAEEIADLSQMTTCPIALGERLMTRWDFRPYLERRAIDIAQPDIAHCGGISELRRIASFCEVYDVALAPHCPLGPIALAASLQVGITAPNFVIQEMSWQMHYNQGADLFTYMLNPEVFSVKDGHVEALAGPGLGININEKLVREASEKYLHEKAWRNATWRGEDGSLREW